jgi:hypothetical protein
MNSYSYTVCVLLRQRKKHSNTEHGKISVPKQSSELK